MTERAEKFLAAVSEDPALKSELEARLRETGQKEQYAAVAAFAKEKGFVLEEADLGPEAGEMDVNELGTVAGGSGCGCAVYGSGKGALDCRCYVAGIGECDVGKGITSEGGCLCTVGGAGASNKKKV